MAKVYSCDDCGKTFDKPYKRMLHADFHLGEPVVRPIACSRCAQDVDVRNGYCLECGYQMTEGWYLPHNKEKITQLKETEK